MFSKIIILVSTISIVAGQCGPQWHNHDDTTRPGECLCDDGFTWNGAAWKCESSATNNDLPQGWNPVITTEFKITYFGTTDGQTLCDKVQGRDKRPAEDQILAIRQDTAQALFKNQLPQDVLDNLTEYMGPVCGKPVKIVVNGQVFNKIIWDVCLISDGCEPNTLDNWLDSSVTELCQAGGSSDQGACRIQGSMSALQGTDPLFVVTLKLNQRLRVVDQKGQ